MDAFRDLASSLGEENVKRNEPLSRHTTFRIGGAADYFVTPRDKEGLRAALLIAKDYGVPTYYMGNGSNLLFADEGYRGMVLRIGKGMDEVKWLEGGTVSVGAGAALSGFALGVAKKGLTGFEFAAGIPGSVGGAVVMNAGAYGGEIKDALRFVEAVDASGKDVAFAKEEVHLDYRSSVFQRNGCIVTSATFEFEPGEEEEVWDTIRQLNARRKEKQPLEYPSAGSTFKRPQGHFAAKLVEDAGLKGSRVGDAMVSEKHGGFIINVGNATAADVLGLVERVRREVYKKFQVDLEPEVRLVGGNGPGAQYVGRE